MSCCVRKTSKIYDQIKIIHTVLSSADDTINIHTTAMWIMECSHCRPTCTYYWAMRATLWLCDRDGQITSYTHVKTEISANYGLSEFLALHALNNKPSSTVFYGVFPCGTAFLWLWYTVGNWPYKIKQRANNTVFFWVWYCESYDSLHWSDIFITIVVNLITMMMPNLYSNHCSLN